MTTSLATLATVILISQNPSVQRYQMPSFEGGSIVEIKESGNINVWDLKSRKLKWVLHMGKSVDAVLFEKSYLLIRTDKTIRSVGRGVALWSIDFKEAPRSWSMASAHQLSVQLPSGTRWIDSSAGYLCPTPSPCKAPKKVAVPTPRSGHLWKIHRDDKAQIANHSTPVINPPPPLLPSTAGVLGPNNGRLLLNVPGQRGATLEIPLMTGVLSTSQGTVHLFPSGRNSLKFQLDKEKRVRRITNH